MSWTPPRTYVVDEVLTAPILNTDHRDNLLAISHPYDYAPADVDVANTVTETSLWSKVITGDDLGTSGTLELQLLGDVLYNNDLVDTITLRIKFGGVTQVTTSGNTLASALSATRQLWIISLLVANKGATNAQF